MEKNFWLKINDQQNFMQLSTANENHGQLILRDTSGVFGQLSHLNSK
jgi:hypothetical protein